jgi:hypothetical protein
MGEGNTFQLNLRVLNPDSNFNCRACTFYLRFRLRAMIGAIRVLDINIKQWKSISAEWMTQA